MATRRTRCQWCGVPLHVPYEARRIHCPNCRRIVQLPEVNGNLNGGMRISPYVGYQRPGPRMPIQMPQLPVHGPKRAVLCGVSYKNHPKSLKGSINDVQSMRHLLVERLGFPSSSVLVLTGKLHIFTTEICRSLEINWQNYLCSIILKIINGDMDNRI